jgi:mono/diheme cytochrome c family protein
MATHEHAETNDGKSDELKLAGYLAEFDNVDDLVHACEKVRDAGYTKWDAHSPFPVHGIDDAMGIKMTILPWIVLGGGLTGLGSAILMQWWMNAVDYPFLISGKPYFSVPASVPIYFELTVLLSAITTFVSVLALNWLPALYHPLFRSERFKRATDDRFFVAIDEADPLFHKKRTKELLEGMSKFPIEDVQDHAVRPAFPREILYGVALAACVTFIPLAIALRARYATSEEARVHLIWDMDWQPKYKAQRHSPFFEDGRAMRPQVAGTVAISDVVEDDQILFTTGKSPDGAFLTELPLAADALPAAMERGRERYGIYCAPCHGLSGAGDGIVNRRATSLQLVGKAVWAPAKSLHDEAIRVKPVGDYFNTITHGLNTMPAYKGQIGPEDRWAIVLYLRALQRSQWAEAKDVPQDELSRLGVAAK